MYPYTYRIDQTDRYAALPYWLKLKLFIGNIFMLVTSVSMWHGSYIYIYSHVFDVEIPIEIVRRQFYILFLQ